MAEKVKAKVYDISDEDWFADFLDLPNGIPSHDTFNRVFSALDRTIPPNTPEHQGQASQIGLGPTLPGGTTHR